MASMTTMTDGASVDVADAQILARQIIRGLKTLRDHLAANYGCFGR
ncbi:hypothetical protein [Streptomyces sp. NPDC001388]